MPHNEDNIQAGEDMHYTEHEGTHAPEVTLTPEEIKAQKKADAKVAPLVVKRTPKTAEEKRLAINAATALRRSTPEGKAYAAAAASKSYAKKTAAARLQKQEAAAARLQEQEAADLAVLETLAADETVAEAV